MQQLIAQISKEEVVSSRHVKGFVERRLSENRKLIVIVAFWKGHVSPLIPLFS